MRVAGDRKLNTWSCHHVILQWEVVWIGLLIIGCMGFVGGIIPMMPGLQPGHSRANQTVDSSNSPRCWVVTLAPSQL